MASLEAKILGEKAENNCSSDEGEPEEDKEEAEPQGQGPRSDPTPEGLPPPQKWGGTSQNTGPKGVLRDWELFKEHEKMVRLQQEQELIRKVKETSLSCRTEREDRQAEKMIEDLKSHIDPEEMDLDELLSDKVLEQFVKQRMDSMSERVTLLAGPGLISLTSGEKFLEVVDNSDQRVPVVIHIYEERFPECTKLNSCLESLSELYPQVQFCKIRADAAGVSQAFKAKGVPAMLVYKGGSLIGNFVQLKEEFGTEFYHGDVENFLIENGMIQDRNTVPALLAAAKKANKIAS